MQGDDESLHDLAVVHHLLALWTGRAHVCNESLFKILGEQNYQLAKLYGRLCMSDTSGMQLVADCHGVTEVNLITALELYSMTSSIEALEPLERAYELLKALSMEVFP